MRTEAPRRRMLMATQTLWAILLFIIIKRHYEAVMGFQPVK
jgi:hypothetical protein